MPQRFGYLVIRRRKEDLSAVNAGVPLGEIADKGMSKFAIGIVLGSFCTAFVFLLIVAVRPTPRIANKPKVAPPHNDPKYWIDLYNNVNTLLWSRLQTIAVVQLAVLTAWWKVHDQAPWMAPLVAALGAIASWVLLILLRIDIHRRGQFRVELNALVDMPEVEIGPFGCDIILRSAISLTLLDFGLAILSFANLVVASENHGVGLWKTINF